MGKDVLMPDKMEITIYHNPRCGTSRAVLGLIRALGVEPKIIEYLKTPLSRLELVALVSQCSTPLRDILRAKEPIFKDLGLDDLNVTDDQLIDAMVAHPILMNRPIVTTSKGTKLCRPIEVLQGLLP